MTAYLFVVFKTDHKLTLINKDTPFRGGVYLRNRYRE